MLRLSCSFCAHRNPEGSKFCNQCGSPLNLAACPRCEAINNLSDPQCSHCGAPLSSVATEEVHEGAASLREAAQSVASPPAQDAPVPLALADRLEAVPWELRARSIEKPAAVDDPPSPAVIADRDRHDDESSSAAHGGRVGYPARNAYGVPAIMLGILFVALAAAAYWMSTQPTPPDPRPTTSAASTGVPESIARAPPAQTADHPADSNRAASGNPPTAAEPLASAPTSSPSVAQQPLSPGEEPAPPSARQKPEGVAAPAPARAHKARPNASRSDKSTARASEDKRRPAVARTREQAERDAIATQRLIDRELAEPSPADRNAQ